MADYKLFSADSHVTEPPNLWVERIDRQFSFRAPRVISLEKDGRAQDFMIYEGYPPHPVEPGIGAAGRELGGGNGDFKAKSYHEALPGGWDPAIRLKDQETDGVDGEIIHPTLGFRMFWLKDAALQRACFRVYNDWLAEMCSYAPNRLFGIPMISLYDIDLACEELRRVNKLGLKGAMVWQQPPADFKPYSDPYYDPFWATAQGLGCTHRSSRHHRTRREQVLHRLLEPRVNPRQRYPASRDRAHTRSVDPVGCARAIPTS